MATHASLTEENETPDTIELMIFASDEFAANLAESRDKWAAKDHELARLIEGLRIQFAAFAAAARSGRLTDLVMLRTIGRAYESVAVLVHELATEAEGFRAARDCLGKAAQLTGRVSDMVERSRN